MATSGPIACAWQHPRAGAVRDAFYLDGGRYWTATWDSDAKKWQPQNGPQEEPAPPGELQRFNYTMPFQSTDTSPINITSRMVQMPLTVGGNGDATSYSGGALLTSSLELYGYGYMIYFFLVSRLTCVVVYRLVPTKTATTS